MPPHETVAAERIFLELIEFDPAQRTDRLAAACAGDDALRGEVEALLDAAGRGPAYLDGLRERLGLAGVSASAAVGAIARRMALDPTPEVETGQFVPAPVALFDAAGAAVGPYCLIRELGRGGMGTVWLAKRSDLLQGRQVALKLPHHAGGAWKRAGLAERLAREREILAKLEHPNIARLYDAGVTAQGQPWLALEYVRGERIDLYCQTRALPLAGRLQLYLQVARAVAHAHAHLVVHRDLKPANILVTGSGEVKLLDFGIAKLVQEGVHGGLAAETELTRDDGRALTPDYASPEQILGQPIGTASDVYSLGVLLFELLADVRPYKLPRATRAALEEAIAAGDMPRPSARAPAARRRQLRGDLDTIVLKALKRDPAQRYATVAALAEDVQRHLDLQPVLARPDSAAYRLRTFVRRHRLAVGAGGAVLVALVSGTGVALWQGVEAMRQRDLATYQQWRAQTSSEFLGFLVTDLGASGRPVTSAELLERGAAMVQTRADAAPPPWAGPVLYELASAYFTLEMPERATELLARAEAASRAHDDHDLLASILCTRSRLLLRTDPTAARRLAAEAQALPLRSTDMSAELLNSCGRARALLLESDGDRPAAIAALQATLARVRAVAPELRRPQFTLLNELARMHFDRRDLPAALAASRDLQVQMEAAGLGRSLGYLITGLNISSVLTALGEIADSLQLQTQLMERIQGLPPEARPKGFVLPMATNLIRLGRADEALQLVAADEAALQEAGEKPTMHQALTRARALIFLGRTAEGLRVLEVAEAELRKAERRNDRLLDNAAMSRVRALRRQGNLAAASAAAEALLQAMGHMGGPRTSPDLLHGLKLAAQLALEMGDAARARQLASDALAAAERLRQRPDASADIGQALMLRARARQTLGDAAAARADAASAVQALARGLGADHPETIAARSFAVAR